MQTELTAMGVDVQILGINEEGYESSLSVMAAVADLPLLQDTAAEDVWGTWDVTWRDVYVLNPENELYSVYNLTTHTLADDDNYEELKAIFVAASGG